MQPTKRVDELTIEDIRVFPVWEYTNTDEDEDETVVRPVKRMPVKSLTGRIVGTEVTLADGTRRWATLSNIDETNRRLTEHFLTLSVFDRGAWFTMARYHDVDAAKRGPTALATFLGMSLDAVFPISYDISRYCVCRNRCLDRYYRQGAEGAINARPGHRTCSAPSPLTTFCSSARTEGEFGEGVRLCEETRDEVVLMNDRLGPGDWLREAQFWTARIRTADRRRGPVGT
jgi:hypothetical protein